MSNFCGCWHHPAPHNRRGYYNYVPKQYLPLLESEVHSTILSTTSRTVLKQTFKNPSTTEDIKECTYAFPLYDGVSVVSFTCRVGKKILHGLVKEKAKAKAIFNSAVTKGETAGYLEQSPEASDMFSTKLGNIPAGESVIVEITYIGELKHHETDGIRFTIPTKIAPRYGAGPEYGGSSGIANEEGIKIVVDINMPEDAFIKGVQSPSHPIAVSLGAVSTASDAVPTMRKASATLSLGSTALEKDFVLIVLSKDTGNPKALLETHPTIPNHRALMVSLVPKFSLPPSRPEIVFLADRSGSMQNNIPMLISAMNVFLKSMPAGVKFNICSFGWNCSFLWDKSQSYTKETLDQASKHVKEFSANFGGTETFRAVEATIKRRWSNLPLEVILLTDGDIQDQARLFKYVNEHVEKSKGNIRVFPLGIGNGVSSSLIEGLARAGNGFSQSVQDGERLDNCVVRMLRGALTPHTTDYTLEVKYDQDDDDFEVIETVTEGLRVLLSDREKTMSPSTVKTPISLFDTSIDPEKDSVKETDASDHYLPKFSTPKLLQAPHKIPSLYAFARTSVYLLMSPDTMQRNPTSVVLRATSAHGPLELEISIEVLTSPAETIHQLAAKKAVQDLEEGRGWIFDAKNQDGKLVKAVHPSCFDDLVQREAVRLGEKFQIAGKWCSFVAVSANDEEIVENSHIGIDHEAGVESGIHEPATIYRLIRLPKSHVMGQSAELSSAELSSAELSSEAGRRSAPSSLRPGWDGPTMSLEVVDDLMPKVHSYSYGVALDKDLEPQGEEDDDMDTILCPAPPPLMRPICYRSSPSYAMPQVGPAMYSFASPSLKMARQMGSSTTFRAFPPSIGFGSGQFGGIIPAAAPQPMGGQPSGLLGLNSFSTTPASLNAVRERSTSQKKRKMSTSSTSPISPMSSPTSPAFLPSSAMFSPNLPMFSPTSPGYSPTTPPPSNTPPAGPSAIPTSIQDQVLALIDLQNFDGFWVAEACNTVYLIMDIADTSHPSYVHVNVWLTILVIQFLQEKCAGEQGTWERVVEKAEAWLEGCGQSEIEGLKMKASLLLG